MPGERLTGAVRKADSPSRDERGAFPRCGPSLLGRGRADEGLGLRELLERESQFGSSGQANLLTEVTHANRETQVSTCRTPGVRTVTRRPR